MRGIVVFFFLIASLCGQAQKIGHLNLGNLLAEMPQTKEADAKINAFSEASAKSLESKAKVFEEDFKAFQQQAVNGLLSPKEQAEKEQALQKKQQELITLEREESAKIQARREELLTPILSMIEQTVQAYAQENGYSMILDSSLPNFILFAEDSDDLTQAIKDRL